MKVGEIQPNKKVLFEGKIYRIKGWCSKLGQRVSLICEETKEELVYVPIGLIEKV